MSIVAVVWSQHPLNIEFNIQILLLLSGKGSKFLAKVTKDNRTDAALSVDPLWIFSPSSAYVHNAGTSRTQHAKQ